jgi:NAD(P)H-quinone oxidoreductase subunit 4
VAPRETIPAVALAAAVVLLGLWPSSLGRLSEVATSALARLTALPGGVG